MFERRAIEKRFGRAGLAAFLGAVTTEGAARPRLVEVAALAWVEAERRRQTLRFALRGEVAVPFTCVDGLADVLHEAQIVDARAVLSFVAATGGKVLDDRAEVERMCATDVHRMLPPATDAVLEVWEPPHGEGRGSCSSPRAPAAS